jgi:hypothetical protein
MDTGEKLTSYSRHGRSELAFEEVMKIVLKTAAQPNAEQPKNHDTIKYVRKSWRVYAVYYVCTSLVVGLGLTAVMFGFAVFGGSGHGKHKPLPDHAPILFLTTVVAVLSTIVFLIELATGPFVFTKDVVCKECHTRLKVKRIAFFAGKYSRPPKCECGGKIEPAFLWAPEVSERDSIKS